MTLMEQPSSDVGTPIYDQLVLEMWPEELVADNLDEGSRREGRSGPASG